MSSAGRLAVNTLAGTTGGAPRSGTATSIGVQGRIPLYQGGLPAARIAQSVALEAQTLEQRVAVDPAPVPPGPGFGAPHATTLRITE